MVLYEGSFFIILHHHFCVSMKTKCLIFSLTVLFLSFTGCVKERTSNTGFLDIKDTNWEITGRFLDRDVTLPVRFTPDGKGTFGNLNITWIQSGNEVLWLTTDNTKFEGRLSSAAQMRGSFYINNAEVPTGAFTGRRSN
jgi:hypothetical protein